MYALRTPSKTEDDITQQQGQFTCSSPLRRDNGSGGVALFNPTSCWCLKLVYGVQGRHGCNVGHTAMRMLLHGVVPIMMVCQPSYVQGQRRGICTKSRICSVGVPQFNSNTPHGLLEGTRFCTTGLGANNAAFTSSSDRKPGQTAFAPPQKRLRCTT